MEGTLLFWGFFSWWYGVVIAGFFGNLRYLFLYLYDFFSVEVCLRTLLSVWRRDLLSTEGLALSEIFQAWTLNLASRLIGCLIKLLVIAIYLVCTVAFCLISVILILISTFFPFLLLGSIVVGLLFVGGVL